MDFVQCLTMRTDQPVDSGVGMSDLALFQVSQETLVYDRVGVVGWLGFGIVFHTEIQVECIDDPLLEVGKSGVADGIPAREIYTTHISIEDSSVARPAGHCICIYKPRSHKMHGEIVI